MTKIEYMNKMTHKLRRLPKEDFDTAIAYFEEYFADAGAENEQQAIEDLGSPETAADQVIMNLAVKNTNEQPLTVKRSFSALWVGILGVCAAPIALPLAFAFIAVAFSLVIVVLALLFSLFITAIALTITGFIGILVGIFLLFGTFASGLSTMGLFLVALGAGILLTYASIILCKWFLNRMSKLLGNITKRRRKHENK